MIIVNFSIHVKCQSLNTFPVGKQEIFRVFSFRYCQADDYGNAFLNEWLRAVSKVWKLVFLLWISLILQHQWDLQMLSTSHGKATHHYTGTAWWGQQLSFMSLLIVCNTWKPHLPAGPLFMWGVRHEKFLPLGLLMGAGHLGNLPCLSCGAGQSLQQ